MCRQFKTCKGSIRKRREIKAEIEKSPRISNTPWTREELNFLLNAYEVTVATTPGISVRAFSKTVNIEGRTVKGTEKKLLKMIREKDIKTIVQDIFYPKSDLIKSKHDDVKNASDQQLLSFSSAHTAPENFKKVWTLKEDVILLQSFV